MSFLCTEAELREITDIVERGNRKTDQELLSAFDDLYQSPDYLLAVGRAHNMPSGTSVRRDAEEFGRIRFEKNGAIWKFERGRISRTTTQQRSSADFYGQMTFDVSVV